MSTPSFRTAEHFQQQMLGAMIARARITDVSERGVYKNIASGVAIPCDEISYQMGNLKLGFDIATAVGPDLDARLAEILPRTCRRLSAVQASASLTFSRLGTSGATVIQGGTQVKNSAGITFATLQDATIADGQSFIQSVTALCQTPGSIGNVAANTLTQFSSKPPGVDSVTNIAAVGGVDVESDDSYRQRGEAWVSSLSGGTSDSIIQALLGAQDPDTGNTILYADVFTDINDLGRCQVYISDATGAGAGHSIPITGEVVTRASLGPPAGASQGGEKALPLAHKPLDGNAAISIKSSTRGELYPSLCTVNKTAGVIQFYPALVQGEVITAGYSYYDGIIALAQKIVDGDPNDRVNYPGKIAAGNVGVVQEPELRIGIIDATIVPDSNYQSASVYQAVTVALTSLMQGLHIGENLLRSRIIQKGMEVPGVVNFTLNTPTQDILASQGQIIRPSTGSITLH